MRVLWLSHFVPYPPTGHGALQRSYHLLAQAARRHEVHLVALDLPGSFAGAAALADAVTALERVASSVTVFPLRDGGRTRRALGALAAAAGGPSYWERRYTRADVRAHLAADPRARAAELVHLDTVFLAGYADALPRAPLVLNHHNVESQLLARRAEHARGPARAYWRAQGERVRAREAGLAPRAAVNLVVSTLDGERLREVAPGSHTHVVPNGVDVDYFRPAADAAPAPGSLVWIGGMDWFPNRDAIEWTAAELWPALAADDPARALTVVGRQPPPALLELAERDPRVRAPGFVDDVRPYVWGAEVFLCPIRVGGGTRLKVVNVLGMGRPLVSTGVGVEGLRLREDVHYLRAETPAEFVAQVRRLQGDAALRERVARHGLEFVRAHYAWERVGEELGAAYDAASGAPGCRDRGRAVRPAVMQAT